MSEGDWKQPMLLHDLSEEGATEVDQYKQEKKGDEENGESFNRNCDVTVKVFSFS